MDLLGARQKLVATNIANADTPVISLRIFDFQSELRSATGAAPRVSEVAGLQVKNDGNNVSLDANRVFWRKMPCASNWLRS